MWRTNGDRSRAGLTRPEPQVADSTLDLLASGVVEMAINNLAKDRLRIARRYSDQTDKPTFSARVKGVLRRFLTILSLSSRAAYRSLRKSSDSNLLMGT